MQSKLSKLQKSILTFLYEGPLSVRELICSLHPKPTHGFGNTVYKSLDSLEERGLIYSSIHKKYRKKVSLTDEGTDNAREILIQEGECVRFCLTNGHLKMLIKKLSMNTFKESVVLIRDGKFISVHRNPHSDTIRFFEAYSDFFTEISGRGLFVFPIRDVKRITSRFSKDDVIEFEMQGNMMKIVTPTIPIKNKFCKDPEDIFTALPYDWQSDLTFYRNMKIFTRVHMTISPSDLKEIISNLHMINTNLLTLSCSDSKVSFISNETTILSKQVSSNSKDDFRITMNNGFKKLKNVFDEEICIRTDALKLAIFSEKTQDYSFGLLVQTFRPRGEFVLT